MVVPLKPAAEQLGKDDEFKDGCNSSENKEGCTERQIDTIPMDCDCSPYHTVFWR